MPRLAPLPVLLFLAACPSPFTHFQLEQPGQAGSPFGRDGPWGVQITHELMDRAVPPRTATVVLPLGHVDDASSLPEHVPGLVLVQGGLVARDRYLWLARHLATRGFAVIMPEYTGWLALFEPFVAKQAADHLRDILGDHASGMGILGHSLGGVAATSAWLDEGEFEALALLASEANEADDVESRAGPVLLIAGERDQSQSVSAVRASYERFDGPAFLAVVEDLTHFSWTEQGFDPTVLREWEPPSPTLPLARQAALFALDAYLAWVMEGNAEGQRALMGERKAPPGVALEHRN